MKHEFRLADIGEGLEEAEIISWLVNVGDVVTRDQPLIEVMTDKSNAELPAPAAGIVVELSGAVGDIIHVGELIAVIDEATDATPSNDAPSEPAEPPNPVVVIPSADTPAAEVTPAHAQPAPAPTSDARRIKASPSTRRAAAERGIDLSTITGTGPGGRIVLSDLETTPPAAPASVPAPPQRAQPPHAQPLSPPSAARQPPQPEQGAPAATTAVTSSGTVPLRGVRRAIAQNMAQSWSEIPHIHSFEHIDAEPLLSLRQRMRDSGNATYVTLTPLTFFVSAVAAALKQYPQANVSIDMNDETVTYHPDVNVGVAVAAPAGLVVPVVHQAQDHSFESLCQALGQLVTSARENTLQRSNFQGGTATVTNFGSLGGELATPLIRPPEAIIVGFGAVAPRPFVLNDEVVARKTMHLVLGADHRLIDGDVATAVLHHIAQSLADPLRLVL